MFEAAKAEKEKVDAIETGKKKFFTKILVELERKRLSEIAARVRLERAKSQNTPLVESPTKRKVFVESSSSEDTD